MRDALPPRLAAILAERRGCTVAWTVSARTGATASFTARELVPGAPFEQDISVVLVGVNDALRLTPRRTWRASMDRLWLAQSRTWTASSDRSQGVGQS